MVAKTKKEEKMAGKGWLQSFPPKDLPKWVNIRPSFIQTGIRKIHFIPIHKDVILTMFKKKKINKLQRSQKPTSPWKPLHKKTQPPLTGSLYQLDLFSLVNDLVYDDIDQGIH